MFLQFIGINEKILNLNAIVLIEDASTENRSSAVITTVSGDEITLEGDDADVLFERADLMMKATDFAVAQLQQAEAAQTPK